MADEKTEVQNEVAEDFMNPPQEAETTEKVSGSKAKKADKPVPKKAKTVAQKLLSIQTNIKAPKNLYNSFGGYNYRNAEGILESAKPYLEKEGCMLLLSDSVEVVGTGENCRYYVKATARFIDCESGDCIEVSAMAREALTKKGMDDSQVTGATSSYARKYALNGLFLLDDTKDADTDEFCNQTGAEKKGGSNKTANSNNSNQNFSSNNNNGSNNGGGEKW